MKEIFNVYNEFNFNKSQGITFISNQVLKFNKGFKGKYLKQLANSLTQRKQFLSFGDLCSPLMLSIAVSHREVNLAQLSSILLCQTLVIVLNVNILNRPMTP